MKMRVAMKVAKGLLVGPVCRWERRTVLRMLRKMRRCHVPQSLYAPLSLMATYHTDHCVYI